MASQVFGPFNGPEFSLFAVNWAWLYEADAGTNLMTFEEFEARVKDSYASAQKKVKRSKLLVEQDRATGWVPNLDPCSLSPLPLSIYFSSNVSSIKLPLLNFPSWPQHMSAHVTHLFLPPWTFPILCLSKECSFLFSSSLSCLLIS